MILLDTNIISEMMKPMPSSKVAHWLDTQDVHQLFITTITIAEIYYGLYSLPESKRRSFLENAFHQILMEAFNYRMLSFDKTAAYHYGQLLAYRKQLGRPLSVLDGQIAAIAHVHHGTIATRNILDFADLGLTLVNPFN